ncbi:MAG TPA: hypothetical protein VGN48_02470 [Pedococcus sp.]|nr:hypothetical protein [Pedococcus sp.]
MTSPQTLLPARAASRPSPGPLLAHKASFYLTTLAVAVMTTGAIGLTWLAYHA